MSCLHVTSRSRVQAVETATDIIIRLGCVHYNLGCGPFPDPALNAGRLCTGSILFVRSVLYSSNEELRNSSSDFWCAVLSSRKEILTLENHPKIFEPGSNLSLLVV
ncbi:uncharacterized protein DS421_3g60290 [Arachis hypogaea]|nr:uncharacterized protein DS421_3g60290 [Arachis hypogaea]